MKNITHHVQFTPEDEKKLRAKAYKAGMPVTAYIRLSALKSHVQAAPSPVDLLPVLYHTMELDELAQSIRAITTNPHKDRMLYEADLEYIERMLAELLRAELELVSKIGR